MRAFFLKAVVCCAMLMLAQTQSSYAQSQNWIDFRSDAGRYVLLFPVKPEYSTQDIAVSGGRKAIMHQAIAEVSNDLAYMCMYVDYPEDALKGLTTEKLLDNARNGAAKGHKLRSERKFTIAGHPARELIIDQQSGLTIVSRMVFVPHRLYQVIVAGGAGLENRPDTRKFLDSFALR